MSWLQNIHDAGKVVKQAMKLLARHPLFLVPLLLCWCLYAPAILYLKFGLPWEEYSLVQVLLIVYLALFSFAFIMSLSCLVLLELIQQLETGHKLRLFRAVYEVLFKDFWRSLPVIIIWSAIWFVLVIIEALLSKVSGKHEDEQLSMENAAKTLAGYGKVSITGAIFDLLRKGTRMIVFGIFPAIAWEDEDPVKAIKKGLTCLKVHFREFACNFILTELVALVVFIPTCVLFKLSDWAGEDLPDVVWVGTIIYVAFGWSLCIFLEQMVMAILYMWHLKWEKRCQLAREKNMPLPPMKFVRMPSLVDGFPDLGNI